jgi:N-acetylmuramoyl-L-alanine amidase
MREIQDFHMDDRAFSDIGYNWLIGGDNRAYEGRGWGYVGAHTYGCNSNAVAISLMGNYDTATPTTDMMKATRDIIDCGIQQGYIAPWATVRMFGHRDSPCSSTACPGQNVYNIITGWPWYSNTTPPCQC